MKKRNFPEMKNRFDIGKYPLFSDMAFYRARALPHAKKTYGLMKQSMTVIATLLTLNLEAKGLHVSWSGVGFNWSSDTLYIYLSFFYVSYDRKK